MKNVSKKATAITHCSMDWAPALADGDALQLDAGQPVIDLTVSGAVALVEVDIEATTGNVTQIKLGANAAMGIGRIHIVAHTTGGERLSETIRLIIKAT